MADVKVREQVRAAVDAAESKKAEEVRVLELGPADSALADYFVICSGTNPRQNQAIADEIQFRLKTEFGTMPNSTEGYRLGEWVLMDYVDFVVHIFLAEKREFYNIERLRGAATSLAKEKKAVAKKKASVKKAFKKKVAAKKKPTKGAGRKK